MVKLNSFFQKLILGETLVEKFNSSVNGEIKVYDGWFGRSMRVGGMTQSGWLVEKLWKASLSEIHNTKYIIQNTLILGLGCGDAARLLSQKWPEAKIVGVEIDPKVVEVGRKYFGLDKIENLKIVINDAIEIICNKPARHASQGEAGRQLAISNKFDLILVDLYLGKEFPKEAGEAEFIKGVKSHLNKGGIAIFNRLSYGELSDGAVKFSEKLRQYFPKVWTKKAVTNLLIFCSF